MKRDIELEATTVANYAAVAPVLEELSCRRWAAAESLVIGYAASTKLINQYRSLSQGATVPGWELRYGIL